MLDWLRERALGFCLSAAIVVWGLEPFVPTFVDFILDAIGVALVWAAAWLQKSKNGFS